MKNKKGNVAIIAIIIVIVAITASVITWLVATKSQAPVQQAVVSQPTSTTQTQTATQSATPVTQPVAQNVVYNNTKYGFQLTLPADWKNYRTSFFENAIGGEENPGGTLTFYLPTIDRNYVVNNGDNPSNIEETPSLQGYGEAFILAIYSKNEWNQSGKTTYGKELLTNGNYYIALSKPEKSPSDFLDKQSAAYKTIFNVANEQYLKSNIKFTK